MIIFNLRFAIFRAESTSIEGLGGKFLKHKIAGDVLFAIETRAICSALEVLGPDRAKFMTKLKELKEKGTQLQHQFHSCKLNVVNNKNPQR